MRNVSGTLTVVATPLGDPTDLSPRAAAALREAEIILAEDTRSVRRLLAGLGAPGGTSADTLPRKPILSCFDANEPARAAEIGARLAAGARVALVSEAGTPLVSDPGFRIVRAAIAAGARIVPVPGPSAVLAALMAAGLPTDRFAFLGFPPRKPGARRKLFESFRALPFTLVFFESPLRTGATLADLTAVLGPDRPACVARELTKPHEELVRDTLGNLAARYASDRPLGEITLVIGGLEGASSEGALEEDEMVELARGMVAEGRSTRDTAHALAEETGRPWREIYRALITRLGEPAGGHPGDDDQAGDGDQAGDDDQDR